MRVAETNVYKFSELSDSAKENAREWMRQAESSSFDPDLAYEDLQAIASIMGIEIAQRRQNVIRRDGSHSSYMTPCIYWSGFSSQGDGACFEASFTYSKGMKDGIRAYAPQDMTLHGIADIMADVQKRNFYGIRGNVTHRGHYNHEYCTSFDLHRTDDKPISVSDEELFVSAVRSLMKWFYRQLESEYEYRMSDEAIDETIDANGYEFDESGNVWH